MGRVARVPLFGIEAVETASVEWGTEDPQICQGIREEPAPGGADLPVCFKGHQATQVTAEDWTPGDPQAPSEKGGRARAEILTGTYERRLRG